jgi:hypothetical protein
MDMQQRESFITQYVAMWNEPDTESRHALVRELWARDAENLTRAFSVRGIEQVLSRVDSAHLEWVAKRGFIFRSTGDIDGHHHLIKFYWEMLPRKGGKVEAKGLDVLVFDEVGKIRSLYQFAEPVPS